MTKQCFVRVKYESGHANLGRVLLQINSVGFEMSLKPLKASVRSRVSVCLMECDLLLVVKFFFSFVTATAVLLMNYCLALDLKDVLNLTAIIGLRNC